MRARREAWKIASCIQNPPLPGLLLYCRRCGRVLPLERADADWIVSCPRCRGRTCVPGEVRVRLAPPEGEALEADDQGWLHEPLPLRPRRFPATIRWIAQVLLALMTIFVLLMTVLYCAVTKR